MSRAKGNRTRKKCIDYHEDDGWTVDVVEKTHRFAKEKDLFGGALDGEYTDRGFDIIALKNNHTRYIQVKTNKPSVRKWYKDFSKKFAGENTQVMVWTWYDRKGWRVQEYLPNGKILEVDYRK